MLVWLFVISVCITLTHILLKYVSVVMYNDKHGFFFELSNRFNLNDETSIPQWISHIYFLIIAGSAWLAGRLSADKNKKIVWYIIAGVGVLMSMDDAATLHEFALQSIHNTFFLDTSPSLLSNAWLVLLPFVLLVLGWLAYLVFKTLPMRTALLFTLGGTVFLVGAIFVDSLANTIPELDFLNQGVLAAIEGGVQLLGLSLIIYTIVEYLEQHHQKQLAKAWNSLKP